LNAQRCRLFCLQKQHGGAITQLNCTLQLKAVYLSKLTVIILIAGIVRHYGRSVPSLSIFFGVKNCCDGSETLLIATAHRMLLDWDWKSKKTVLMRDYVNRSQEAFYV
jgi:hypothetical protein